MKVIRTKEIVAKNISEMPDKYIIFKEDRKRLHNGKPPPFFVYILDRAWDFFIHHGKEVYKELGHEAHGIIVGNYFKDDFGDFVVAEKYEEGYGISRSTYVEMSDECLVGISNRCQSHDTLMLVWVHTHPGFNVFYSGTDCNCLKTNFYKPYQIGVVVDILNEKDKGYRIEKSEVIEFCDYALFDEQEKKLKSPFKNLNRKAGQNETKKEIDRNTSLPCENLDCNSNMTIAPSRKRKEVVLKSDNSTKIWHRLLIINIILIFFLLIGLLLR